MKKTVLQIISALLMGIIIGSAGMSLHISRDFEELTADNHLLREELESKQADLEEMKKYLYKQQQKKVITNITANVDIDQQLNDIPSFEAASIQSAGKKKIQELLEPLLYQEINNVNYKLIPRIIDGREFTCDGKRYILKTDVVIIVDELQIFATASIQKEN